MNLLEYTYVFLYYLLLKPEKSFNYIFSEKGREKYLGIAIAVGSIAYIFNLIGEAIVLKNQNLITFFLEFNLILYIIGFWGNIILISAFWYLIQNFFSKQKIEGSLLVKSLFLTYYPLILSPIFAIISIFILPSSPKMVYSVLKIGIWFWIISLQIFVLRNIFKIKLLSAFLLYILPILGLIGFIIIKIWALISSIILKTI